MRLSWRPARLDLDFTNAVDISLLSFYKLLFDCLPWSIITWLAHKKHILELQQSALTHSSHKIRSILRNSRFESGRKCQQGDQKADFRSWVFVCSGSGHAVLLLRLRLKEPRACEVCHGRSCKNYLVSRKFWSNCTYESFWRRSWRLLSSLSCPADWLLAHGRRTRTRSQGLWGLERVLILSHWWIWYHSYRHC